MIEECIQAVSLNQIDTSWTLLRQAHAGSPESTARARNLLARRYQRAVTRYLRRMGCAADEADDVSQRFFLGLLRGELRSADPQKGSFRTLIKVVLRHLLGRERRMVGKGPLPVQPDALLLTNLPADSPDQDEEVFDETWRSEVLDRTWEALAQVNPRYHQVLQLRAQQPNLPSHQLAELLADDQGPVSAAAVRKTLERARARFAQLLIEEVARSLEAPSPESINQELAELRLLKYCAAFLPSGGA